MSQDDSPFDGLLMESEKDFKRALHDLVEVATKNGIGVRGEWTLKGGDNPLDLGVEIHRVVRSSD